ncbi:MAG: HD domain-containing phosphohydrolase [Nitrospirota bacterium]
MSLELKKALYHISSLVDLGQEVTSSKNFYVKIQSVLYSIMGTFLANRGAIFVYEKDTGALIPLAKKGFQKTEIPMLTFSIEHMLPLRKNEPCRLGGNGNSSALFYGLKEELLQSGFEIFIPLWVRDEFIGAIALSSKFTEEPYTPDDLELLRVIAHQIGITLSNHALFINLSEQLDRNRKLYEEMRRIYHDTIQAFAAAIDAKDAYTKNHSQRVARYSVAIARELGWSESDIEGIYIAGFLHDVGKLVVNNEVLNKKEPLTNQEWHELRSHSSVSYKISSKIKFPWKDVVKMIKHHHERLDGNGYPDSLTGADLSEGAKILILADSFDAMTTDRPYKPRLELREALEELKKCLGTQFEPRIVAAFCRVLDKEIKGELPEPHILPHLDEGFDPSIISEILQALIEELSE